MAALIACVGVAAASLVLPFAPAYDPWAWLVWGQELGTLDLDTTAGPSWKPLPVAVDAVFAPLGDIAPELWLVVARAGWMAALVLAWRAASRLGGGGRSGIVAGAVAALGLLLLEDSYTAWLRQFAGGLAEPLLVALCLLAVDRALSERHGQALLAGAAAALIRPEAWPFLAVYAIWAWRRDARLRWPAALAGVAVALAWFLPDLLGAGNPLEGAERARGLVGGTPGDAPEVLGRGFELVAPALWPLAVLAVAVPVGSQRRTLRVLALGALAWIALVAAMAVGGYAGLPRFMAPAAAIVCVLAGVGAAEAWGWVVARPRAAVQLAAGAVVAIAVVASLAARAADLPADYRDARDLGQRTDDLIAVAEAAGPASAACGQVITDELLSETALAWTLDLPLSGAAFVRRPPTDAALAFAFAGGPWSEATEAGLGPVAAERGPWRAYRPCAIAGVTGASR